MPSATARRAMSDRASGILMHVLGCEADEAFRVLRRISQRSNRKLAEVADAVVSGKGRGLEKDLSRLAPPD